MIRVCLLLSLFMLGCNATPPEVIIALDRGEKALVNAYASQQQRGELAAQAWAWSERERVSSAIATKTLSQTDDEGRVSLEDVRALLGEQKEQNLRIEKGLEEWRASTRVVDEEHGDALSLLSIVREWLGLEPMMTPEQSQELRVAIDPFLSSAGGE